MACDPGGTSLFYHRRTRGVWQTHELQPLSSPLCQYQALEGNSQFPDLDEENIGSLVEGAKQSVVEVGAKSLDELTGDIEKQIVDNGVPRSCIGHKNGWKQKYRFSFCRSY